MKKIIQIHAKAYKTILFAFIIGISMVSCEDKSDEGTPEVKFIRVTDPAKSDSLLVGAYMGDMIVIVGENLSGIKEIWFNDQRASLMSTFITDQTIIVRVPNTVPSEVTNKIRMVFSDGSELLYDFTINVPPPQLTSIKCEYVPDGDTAVLYGDYFFNPEVIFPGDLKAKILNVTKTQIEVEVPQGATPGPIIVKTVFGKVTSSFVFRDPRGILLDFDTKLGAGWRPGNRRSTDPDGVSGNYLALTGKLKANWDWVDDYLEMDYWGQAAGNPEGPLFTGDPANLVFKFEVNVVNTWSGGFMQLIFSPWSNNGNSVNSDPTIARGLWRPWEETGSYKTDGWITVSIPLSEFKYDHTASNSNLKLQYPQNCGSLTIFVWGPVTAECDLLICIDNVRVVPM